MRGRLRRARCVRALLRGWLELQRTWNVHGRPHSPHLRALRDEEHVQRACRNVRDRVALWLQDDGEDSHDPAIWWLHRPRRLLPDRSLYAIKQYVARPCRCVQL
jgi:hypothetical protein